MNKTVLVIGIIFLLIGASVVSSTDNSLKEIPVDCSPLESVYRLEDKSSIDTVWYVFMMDGFYAFYPNNTYRFGEWEGDDFFSGGTWTNDGRYLCCMFGNGTLYDINPKTFDACAIGDGGVSLNGLAYNPVNEKLYGASSYDLYEIDIETGNQTYIGGFGSGPNIMIAIAFDKYGVLYGWDVGNDSLWIIDNETGNATLVGPLGWNLKFAQDGAFEYHTDILYLVAYTIGGPKETCVLECDEDTGECELIGNLQREATAHAISYELDNEPPVTNITFDPPEPNGCNDWYISNVTVALNATDNMGVLKTYYRVNGGDWEIYDSPFVISEDGDDIFIVYYSIDYNGNVEDGKTTWLDIDKTPPNMTVEWDVEKVDWRKWAVTFYIEVTDATSGSEGLEIYLNDGLQATLPGPGPFMWSFIISGGLHFVLKFVACDMACNQAIVVVNSSEINSFTYNQNIFTHQSNHLWLLRFLERFPLLERLLNLI